MAFPDFLSQLFKLQLILFLSSFPSEVVGCSYGVESRMYLEAFASGVFMIGFIEIWNMCIVTIV